MDLVTGAFGYTGSFIADRLLARGRQVRTLTRRPPDGHPLGTRIEAVPLRFDKEGSLIVALRGVDTLYNTFWRRFPRPGVGFADIVAQSELLIAAASTAGVRRIVHFSVSNASDDAPTSYFRAKAQVEQIVRASGISYAILRPTLLYGPGDILLSNLAWTLRRVPVFGIPGAGDYPVQPVLVSDVAELAVRLAETADDVTITAAGPETYRFADLVRLIRDRIRVPARIVGVPPLLALVGSRVIGRIVHDIVLTRDEITELMAGLLVSAEPPTCPTPLSEWLETQAKTIGRRYSSELARNYRGLAGPTR
jgi:NADH dehydrogenase